jgi:hypothetical protein
VSAWWQTVRSALVGGRAARESWNAFGISSVVHLCVLGVLGLLVLPGSPDSGAALVVETLWSAPEGPREPFPAEVGLDEDLSPDPGGSSLAPVPLVVGTDPLPPEVPPLDDPATRLSALLTQYTDLSQPVRPVGGGTGASDDAGTGQGLGDGVGDGSGSTFFGLTAPGKKFAFVVDCSGSMNRPFDGPGKTLLGRVKLEILKCVAQMTPEQQFYIVFFNDGAIPMPSDALAAATPEAKQRYLRWMAGAKGGGNTEPEAALLLALRLEPDVIYFLTDGVFKYRVVRHVNEMNRRNVTIHTVCFGGGDNERFMREIASQNHGTYQFVSAAAAATLDTPPAAAAQEKATESAGSPAAVAAEGADTADR